MPNYGYHTARAEGRVARRIYQSLLPIIPSFAVLPPTEVPLEVFSYSGDAGMPEQVASIRSFLQFVGRPRSFTVVSDGTHSSRSSRILRALDRSVRVTGPLPVGDASALPPAFHAYLTNHPTGKQLALIMQLPVNGPSLYVDSDVLFFPGADDLTRLVRVGGAPAFYLPDCRLSGDERLFHAPEEKDNPVNTGVALFFEKIDWSRSVERFNQLDNTPNFFTNQTMTHLAMHWNGALPLDKSKYVLELDDQFVYPDRHAGSEVVLRHYVNPVRHKFWTILARRLRG